MPVVDSECSCTTAADHRHRPLDRVEGPIADGDGIIAAPRVDVYRDPGRRRLDADHIVAEQAVDRDGTDLVKRGLQRVPLTSTWKSLPSGSRRKSIWSFIGPDCWSPSMTSSAGCGRGGAAMPVKDRSSRAKSFPAKAVFRSTILIVATSLVAGVPLRRELRPLAGRGTVRGRPDLHVVDEEARLPG